MVNVDGSARERLAPGARPDWIKGKPAINVGKEWEDYVYGPDERTVVLNWSNPPRGDWQRAVFLIGQGNVRRLTDNDREDLDPSFRPTSSRWPSAVSRQPARGDDHFLPGDIDVINADGTGERNLTDSPEDESDPAWAPKP